MNTRLESPRMASFRAPPYSLLIGTKNPVEGINHKPITGEFEIIDKSDPSNTFYSLSKRTLRDCFHRNGLEFRPRFWRDCRIIDFAEIFDKMRTIGVCLKKFNTENFTGYPEYQWFEQFFTDLSAVHQVAQTQGGRSFEHLNRIMNESDRVKFRNYFITAVRTGKIHTTTEIDPRTFTLNKVVTDTRRIPFGRLLTLATSKAEFEECLSLAKECGWSTSEVYVGLIDTGIDNKTVTELLVHALSNPDPLWTGDQYGNIVSIFLQCGFTHLKRTHSARWPTVKLRILCRLAAGEKFGYLVRRNVKSWDRSVQGSDRALFESVFGSYGY